MSGKFMPSDNIKTRIVCLLKILVDYGSSLEAKFNNETGMLSHPVDYLVIQEVIQFQYIIFGNFIRIKATHLMLLRGGRMAGVPGIVL